VPGAASLDLTATKARIVWNPQGYGSPDVRGNSAQAYYPGDGYVDVVANDLYDQGFNAAWDANEALYAAHRNKPYALAEWGLWGIDDPAFVERMAAFVKSHRVEFLAYFNSKPGAIWDLGSKPRSRAAYRRLITPLGR
jgi:beta-mannanase